MLPIKYITKIVSCVAFFRGVAAETFGVQCNAFYVHAWLYFEKKGGGLKFEK